LEATAHSSASTTEGELDQNAVARRLDDAATMLDHQRIDCDAMSARKRSF
jgi:hypothetical protein